MRTYGGIAGRQSRIDRPVADEADLRRVLGEAANDGTVATIRLAADIVLSRPISLQTATYSCIIDGGGRYSIKVATGYAFDHLFNVGTSSPTGLEFRDVGLVGVAGTTFAVAALFSSSGAASIMTGVSLRGCGALYIATLFVARDGTAPTWKESVVDDVSMDGGAAALTASVGSCVFVRCDIKRVYRYLSTGNRAPAAVSPQVGSGGNLFSEVSVGGSVHFTLQGGVTTSGAVSATIAQFTPNPSKSYLLTARILGRRTNGTDPGQTDTWIISQQFKVSSAGVVTVGAVLSTASTLDDGTWTAAMDTSGGAIRVRAAGVAAQNISWTTTTTIDEL